VNEPWIRAGAPALQAKTFPSLPCCNPRANSACRASFELHSSSFHRRLLAEIGNCGFGPSDDLLGLPGGRPDADGRSVVELRHQLFADDEGSRVPSQVVPLCDWSGEVWSCVDEDTGNVLTLDESGLFDTGVSLEDWMKDWVLVEISGRRCFSSRNGLASTRSRRARCRCEL
jgi:hypothetical protein